MNLETLIAALRAVMPQCGDDAKVQILVVGDSEGPFPVEGIKIEKGAVVILG
jgi:hypothetical protein